MFHLVEGGFIKNRAICRETMNTQALADGLSQPVCHLGPFLPLLLQYDTNTPVQVPVDEERREILPLLEGAQRIFDGR